MFLEPNSCKHKSNLAFYYYNLVMDNKKFNKEAYKKAEELYKDLVVNSEHPFKERYRFIKLQHEKFKKTTTTTPLEFYKTKDVLISEYKKVIDSYDSLTEKDKIQEKNNYCKCMFNFCILALDKLNLWNEFVNVKVYKKELIKLVEKTEVNKGYHDYFKNKSVK